MDLPHYYILDAVAFLRFGMLPGLLANVLLLEPCVTYCGLTDEEEGQRSSSSIVQLTIPMGAPCIPPLIINTPGPHTVTQHFKDGIAETGF